jgi:uncharacterized membrane protein
MTYTPALIVHICAGILGLLSGSVAFAVRKGSRLHRRSGNVFVVSMLFMGASGAYRAVVKSESINMLAGVFTCYLVASAWLTVKRRDGKTGRAEVGLLLLALATALGGGILSWQAAHAATGPRSGNLAGAYLVFGVVALLPAAGDVRMLLRGGLSGTQRLVRHLWRMGFGMFIATVSFFLGGTTKNGLRAQLFTAAVRKTHLPVVPVLLVVLLTIFWVFRVKLSKAYKKVDARAESREVPQGRAA